MPVPGAILGHYRDGRFSGWDLVSGYLQLEEDLDVDIFDEAELEPGSNPVRVTEDGLIVGGKRAFVEALRAGEWTVGVEIAETEAVTEYDDQWIRDSFDDATVKTLRRRRRQLFRRCGAFFYAIIWPTMEEQFDAVEDYLRDRATVVDATTLNLSDNLEPFVRELYTIDEYARDWTIEKKLQELGDGPVRVLELELPDPEIRRGESGGVSKTADRLKTECRRSFQSEIDTYVYDNIVHISDNYRHNRHINRLLESVESGTFGDADE